MIFIKESAWLNQFSKVLLLLTLCYAENSQADTTIDHVYSRVHESSEIIEIVFNQPVQYLYHTPKSDTESMLLGFHMHSYWNKKRSIHRPIAFKQTKFLQSLELYYEKGFNPHLYFEFNTAVNIDIQSRKNLRGFILTIREPISQDRSRQ